jgi:C-terminal processing protease CtpA/Prc
LRLQDHDRGVIVGQTTYGKGLVQQLGELSGGSMVCPPQQPLHVQ